MLLIFLNHLKTSGKYLTILILSGKLILIFFFFIKMLIFLVFICPNHVSTPFFTSWGRKNKTRGKKKQESSSQAYFLHLLGPLNLWRQLFTHSVPSWQSQQTAAKLTAFQLCLRKREPYCVVYIYRCWCSSVLQSPSDWKVEILAFLLSSVFAYLKRTGKQMCLCLCL